MTFRGRLLPPLILLWLGVLEVPALGQTGRVVGTIRDEDGRAIQGATVTADNSSRTFTATTDDDGDFGFVTLADGDWTFTVRAPGFTPSQGRIRVRSLARNPVLEFSLARGAVGRGVGALAAVDSSQLQERLEAAESAYGDGRYDEAILAYREIIASAPTLTTVNLKLGSAYLRNGQFVQARTAYQVALDTSLEPAISREVFYDLGEIQLALRRPDEAAGWYWKAHTTDAAWSKPLLKLGRMALDSGDRPEARRYLTMAADVEPDSEESAEARALLEQLQDSE